MVGPTIRRRRLGADLRRLRENSALKIDDVAGRLGVAPSTLSRIETGKAPTRTGYLRVMLDMYGVHDPAARQQLLELAIEGQRRGWWSSTLDLLPAGYDGFLGLEAEAAAIRCFSSWFVPDLLQTKDYARAVIAATRDDLTAAQADSMVAVQLRRQQVLADADPARLSVILDESVLLRAVGEPGVRERQLEHLLTATELPEVTVRVLSFSAGPVSAPMGSFSILSFADPGDRELLCIAGPRGQAVVEERPDEVRALATVFAALREAALTPAESARLIRDLAN